MADWWLSGGINPANCVAAYQAIGAESYAASKVNLANPGTYDLADGTNYPTWNKDYGWQTTNANQFLSTGYVPDFSVAHSMFVRFSDDSSVANTGLVGVFKSPWYFVVIPVRNTGNTVGYYNGANSLKVSPELTSGVLGIADRNAWRNGVKESGAIPTTTAPINDQQILIFRYNVGASRLAKMQAVAIYDVALTDAQAIAVTNAMMALGNEPEPQTNIPAFVAHYARMRNS